MITPHGTPGRPFEEAHFLEHMLFMGTKKYPDENYFEAKLDALGGSYNAYTDSENTVYHYEVLNDGFEEILDIFSGGPNVPVTNLISTLTKIAPNHSDKWRNISF